MDSLRKKKEIITYTAEETFLFGKGIAKQLTQGGIVCLYGELGAGKTTFVKGLAKGLGVIQEVTSPTFLIMKSYKVSEKGKGKMVKEFYHIDLYRTESEKDFESIGLRDVLQDPSHIVVIEWSEKLGSMLPEKRTDVYFSYFDEKKRKIIIEKHA